MNIIKKQAIGIAMLVGLGVSSAHAEPVDLGNGIFDMGEYLTDTNTGWDWLKLSASDGMNFRDAGLAFMGIGESWLTPDSRQVIPFLTNALGGKGTKTTTQSHIDFANALGLTLETGMGTYGQVDERDANYKEIIMGFTLNDDGTTTVRHAYSQIGSANNYVKNYNAGVYFFRGTVENVETLLGNSGESEGAPQAGDQGVANVSAPAVLGASMALLGLFGRRRKQK